MWNDKKKTQSNIAHQKEEIDPTQKSTAFRQKKFGQGLEHFARVFGKLTTPSGMFLKQKTQILIAHQKEEIDRTQKSTAIRQKKFGQGLEHFVRVFGKLTTPSEM